MASVLGDLSIRVGFEIAEVISGVAAVGKELDGMAKEVERNFAGLERMGSRLKDVGMGMTAAITLPLAGVAAASLKMAADFESGMNKVQAMGDITGQSLKDLEALAMDLGAKTKFSAKEAADGMGELAAAGLNASQIAATMPAVLNLAAAGEIAVGEAAKTSAEMMGQFGIKAEDLGHAIDVTAKAAAMSSASVRDMTQAFKTVGAIATGAGLGIEDVAAAMTVLAQGGRKATQAGTDLRSVLGSLVSPSAKAAEAMASLNINVLDAQGKLKPFGEVMTELSKVTGHTTEIFKIFGREGATGATLLAKAGGEAFNALRKDINNTNDDAKRMAETLTQGLKGAFEKASGSIETLGISIGKALEPAAIAVAGMVEKIANKLGEWATAFGKLPVGVQEAALAFVALAAAVGPVLLVVGTLITSFTSLAAVVGPALAIISTGALVIEGVAVEASAATSAFLGFSAAIAGIAGIALFIEQLGELKDNIKGVISDVSGITDIWGVLTTLFTGTPPLVNDIGQTVAGASGEFKLFGIQLGQTADEMKAANLAWSDMKTAFSNMNWLALLAGPIGALNMALEKFREVWGLIKGQFPEMDTAVRKSAEGLAANAQAHMKVSEAALKSAASTRGLVASADAASAATGKVSKALADTGQAHDNLGKKAEAAAAKAAAAYQKTGEEIKKALDSFKFEDKFSKEIDGVIKSLDFLGTQYAKGRVSVEQYAEASVAAAKKVETSMQASFDAAEKLIHEQLKKDALREIEVKWNIPELGPILKNILDTVSLSHPHIDIGILFPPESIESIKKANEGVLAIDDAMKRVGIDTAKMRETTKGAAQDYITLSEAAKTNSALQTAADQAHVISLKAVISEMEKLGEAYDEDGVSVEQYKTKLEGLKEKLGEVTGKTKEHVEEVGKMGKAWGAFADDVEGIVGKLASDLGKLMFTGEGSFGKIMTQGWHELRDSLLKNFVAPATEILKDFALNSLKALIGPDGIGGVKDAFTAMGKAAKEAFGLAAESAKAAKKVTSSLPLGGDDTGGTGGAPEITKTSSSAGSGLLGALGGVGQIVEIGVQAAAGITAGLQMAHLISTAGKIEVNTREISTVLWQTGAESIQGLTKELRNILLKVNDRIIEVRDALFAPVALAIDMINQTLKTDIYWAIKSIGSVVATSVESVGTAVTSTGNELHNAIQEGIDVNNAQGQDALAIANGIAGAANLTAQQVSDLKNLTQATADRASDQTSTLNSSMIGAITQSGGEVINALGQTGAEAIAGAHQDTEAMLIRLAELGAAMNFVGEVNSNAYDELKSSIKGVSAQSLADQQAAMARLAAQVAAASRVGKTQLELDGFVNPDYMHLFDNYRAPEYGSGGLSTTGMSRDYSNLVTGPAATGGYAGLSSVSMMHIAPQYTAPTADPRTYASPSVGMTRASIYDAALADGTGGRTGGGTYVVQNFNGVITTDQYERDMAIRAAEEIGRVLR